MIVVITIAFTSSQMHKDVALRLPSLLFIPPVVILRAQICCSSTLQIHSFQCPAKLIQLASFLSRTVF